MRKITLLVLILLAGRLLQAQNSIGLQFGFLGTHTSVAEYERIDRMTMLLDSMSLKTNVGSFQAALDAEIGLGKNVYLDAGFNYCEKGLARVNFTDSTGWTWTTPEGARQHYVGISLLIGYKYPFPKSRFGIKGATGLRCDFAVGTPNGGTLFSGPYYRFFLPFSEFNEVDLGWMTEAGLTYKLGPGDVVLKISYIYGFSDVLKDPWVVGRSMSGGISLGYSFRLAR
jgi:hypothetical protein